MPFQYDDTHRNITNISLDNLRYYTTDPVWILGDFVIDATGSRYFPSITIEYFILRGCRVMYTFAISSPGICSRRVPEKIIQTFKIVEAAKTRLRPVLLTAITTILGMSPMAIGVSFDFHKLGIQVGSDSGQMWIAFAWAMIFGLGFATVMTLVIVPCLLKLNFQLFPPKNQEQ